MSTEDRLRDALHREASQIAPNDGWAEIEARVGQAPPRHRGRIIALAAAVAVLVAFFAVEAGFNDPQEKVVTNPGVTTTAGAPYVQDPADNEPAVAVFVWPFIENSPYRSAHDVADAFARTFLGMPDPTVGEFRSGDTTSGEIDVHPYPTGTIGSTLVVAQSDTGWVVTAAMSNNLILGEPHGGTITSPVALRGRSVAFEGTVHVTVLADGTDLSCVTEGARACGTSDGVLANTTYTGGGTEMTPFSVDVPFTKHDGQDMGVIVLWTDSARDGSIAEATIQPVWLVPVAKV